MSRRLIPHGDQDALDALRLGAVVLDRRGEVWQVLRVLYAEQPTRGWFRLGDTGSIYGSGTVSQQGPLRVLYDRGTDLPENVEPCPYCAGTTNDPESDAAAPTLCPACGGAGWFVLTPINDITSLADAARRTPIALAAALDRTAVLAPAAVPQALLPPISLSVGLTVDAEPKAAHTGREPRVRGRVLEVFSPLDEQAGYVDLTILDDGEMVRYRCAIRHYSFRPVEDA